MSGAGPAIVLTALFAAAATSAGHALAQNWRPWWHILAYALLLAAGERFFLYALFDGALLAPAGFGIDAAILLAAGAASYRWTQARRMVRQYPWLYEPSGWFGWRAREGRD